MIGLTDLQVGTIALVATMTANEITTQPGDGTSYQDRLAEAEREAHKTATNTPSR